MMESATIKRKSFNVKPFRQLTIGDPTYFELARKEKKYKQYIFDKKGMPVTDRYAKVVLELVETQETEPFQLTEQEWVLKILVAKKGTDAEKIEEILMGDQYHIDYVKQIQQLGCDTHSFYMNVDGNDDCFHLGGDGQYGICIQYKNNQVLFLHLAAFPTYLFSEKEMLKKIRYFFDIYDEKEWELGEKNQ